MREEEVVCVRSRPCCVWRRVSFTDGQNSYFLLPALIAMTQESFYSSEGSWAEPWPPALSLLLRPPRVRGRLLRSRVDLSTITLQVVSVNSRPTSQGARSVPIGRWLSRWGLAPPPPQACLPAGGIVGGGVASVFDSWWLKVVLIPAPAAG